MTETGPFLNDSNAMSVMRTLIGEPKAMASSNESERLPKILSLGALTRLDYPSLQAMLVLKQKHQHDILFSDLDHLKAALERYGLLDKIAGEGASQA